MSEDRRASWMRSAAGVGVRPRQVLLLALWTATLFLGVHLVLPQLAGLAATGEALALLLPVAATLSISGGDAGQVALGAAAAAAAIVVGVALVPLAIRQPDRAGTLAERAVRRIAVGLLVRWVDAASVGERVRTGIASAKRLLADRRAVGWAFGWAAANWLPVIAGFVLLPSVVRLRDRQGDDE